MKDDFRKYLYFSLHYIVLFKIVVEEELHKVNGFPKGASMKVNVFKVKFKV